MKLAARAKLAQLRRIGWDNWDPIGLKDVHGGSAEDEYDDYLVTAVTMLLADEEDGAVVDYLVAVERDHMGLGDSLSALPRASATVAALRSYLITLAIS